MMAYSRDDILQTAIRQLIHQIPFHVSKKEKKLICKIRFIPLLDASRSNGIAVPVGVSLQHTGTI